MPKFRVIHTDSDIHPLDDSLRDLLQQANAEIVLFRSNESHFAAVAEEADAILNADFRLTAALISSLRQCRVISRFGTGVDNIDVTAATECGIPVANVPEFCTEEVANRAWTLLLACACQLVGADCSVRRAAWRSPGNIETLQIEGQTLGLVGFGKIARAVAKRGRAFGMSLLAYDPYVSEAVALAEGVTLCGLETLLRTSDFISLHVPSTPQTRHLINAKTLTLMKSTAVLVNTARGSLVDEAALSQRLQQDLLAGVGLDVFDLEPPSHDNPLLLSERAILTPHSAAMTKSALARVRHLCVDAVVRVLHGQRPIHVVNPSVLERSSP
jgi:D-3-phosphoglycerate dehydrogenase